MSKFIRVLALVMCCVLLLSLMVSCGEDEIDKVKEFLADPENQLPPEDPYVTLNMYIPSNIMMSQDIINAMQNEFNQVTEAKYRTRVIFKFITEDKYEEELKKKRDDALSQKTTNMKFEPTSVQDKYPKEETGGIQFDIFVATSEKMVREYIDLGAILTVSKYSEELPRKYIEDLEGFNLSEALNTTYYSKFCKDNNATSLVPAFYNSAVMNDIRYGIPANFLIGEYKYYAVKRADADRLFFSLSEEFDPEETDLVAVNKQRIETLEANIVSANAEIEKEGKDIPLYDASKIIYKDVTDLSLYPENEYYHLIMNYPQWTSADIYNGMFCIASTCRYPEKALQVISELYNNKQLHTTLQYGAKEVTYTLKEVVETVDGREQKRTVVVPLIGEDGPLYSVNPRYTGNSAMLYALDDTYQVEGGKLFNAAPLTQDYIDLIYAQNKEAKKK